MTIQQLEDILAVLNSLSVPKSAVFKVEMAIDNSRISLQNAFKLEQQDAEYAVDASGHYAASVTQADAVILKQA